MFGPLDSRSNHGIVWWIRRSFMCEAGYWSNCSCLCIQMKDESCQRWIIIGFHYFSLENQQNSLPYNLKNWNWWNWGKLENYLKFTIAGWIFFWNLLKVLQSICSREFSQLNIDLSEKFQCWHIYLEYIFAISMVVWKHLQISDKRILASHFLLFPLQFKSNSPQLLCPGIKPWTHRMSTICWWMPAPCVCHSHPWCHPNRL